MARTFDYEGLIYVRPVGRGVVLEGDPEQPYLDDVVELLVGGDCRYAQVRLRIEVLESPAPAPGGAAGREG